MAFLVEKVVGFSPDLMKRRPPGNMKRPIQPAKQASHICEGIVESVTDDSDVIVDVLVVQVVSGILFGGVEFSQCGADGETFGDQCSDFGRTLW